LMYGNECYTALVTPSINFQMPAMTYDFHLQTKFRVCSRLLVNFKFIKI
jgi:hypothetical protein